MRQGIKKFYLSFAVISSFFFYGVYERFAGSQTINVVPLGQQDPAPIQNSAGLQTQPPTNTQASNPVPSQTPASSPSGSGQNYYSDGNFTGSVANAYYGNVQVMTTIQNGKITNVQFLQHPGGRMTSMRINSYAMPILTSEAIQAQSSQVDIVSGATDTSYAFIQSLSSALYQSHSI